MRGWAAAPLGEVARIERAVIDPAEIQSDMTYVGLEHVDGNGTFVGVSPLSERVIESAKFHFSERHLLYGKLRPYLAKIACPDFEGICSTDILPILPGPKIERRFLFHLLRQPAMVAHATARSVGANLPRLSPSVLATFEVPVPPLREQRHIAEVLDRAEALRAKRRAALAKFDTLTQAIFLEMFGDPATNPRRWPMAPLSEIGDVITGNTPPRDNPGLFGTAIEWVKSDNLNTPYMYLTRATEGLSVAGRAVSRTVPAGSILVTCIAGTPACIGNAAIADREVAFNQQINAIVPAIADTHFLYVQIVLGKRLIWQASTGGMKGMVSKSRFERIRMVLPPLPLQHEFARRVAGIEKLKTAQRTSLAHLDALFASLQHRAFRGEL